jgi:hypothetical protein
MGIFHKFIFVCATISAFAQYALAEVVILDGTVRPPPLPASTPITEPPSEPASQDKSPDSGGSPASVPAFSASPTAAIKQSLSTPPADLGATKVSNSAEVTVEVLPSPTVQVGSNVSFKITTKKAGYVVLVDVDATGHLTQIYPNTALIGRTTSLNKNYVKAGGKFTIPLASEPYKYVVSPPTGQAMIVAILGAQPVQILDLPDMPPDLKEKSDMLGYLAKWVAQLRIPDHSDKWQEAKWSFAAKAYNIQ